MTTRKATRKKPRAAFPQFRDHALIVDCMAVIACTAAENPTLKGDPDGNWHHANAALKPLHAAKWRGLPRLIATPAQTVDGLIAKANVARFVACEDEGGFEHDCAGKLAASIARDVLRLVQTSQAVAATAKGGAA